MPIAITMGDAAGIGPEIAAKAFRDAPELTRGCFVAGDVGVLRRAARIIGGGLPVALLESAADAAALPMRVLPVVQACEPPGDVPHGRESAAAARAAAQCIVWAARAALGGEVAALVTAPVHKGALALAGVPYPGHTEMLQALAAEHQGLERSALPVRMMLVNDALRTVLVSVHLGLREAIDTLTQQRVLQTITITHRHLAALLGRAPRIAVAGLNPHAGEGGRFGREEIDIIAPAVAEARTAGIDASGPHAPDTVFMRARGFGEFDVVVAMYHDQGLIPVKYLGLDGGVNITLGLPLVRTSPDHGTAFDIAGTGRADASSLLEALRQARLQALPGALP